MIVEQTAVIIEISRKYKDFIFNIDNVKKIIELNTQKNINKIEREKFSQALEQFIKKDIKNKIKNKQKESKNENNKCKCK